MAVVLDNVAIGIAPPVTRRNDEGTDKGEAA